MNEIEAKTRKKVDWSGVQRVIHPRIEDLLTKIYTDYTLRNSFGYYIEYYKYINFWKSSPNTMDTAGVNVDKKGLNFFYNKVFINKCTDTELFFLLLHEVDHLLLNHGSREKMARFTHKKSNIAQDYVINEDLIRCFLNTYSSHISFIDFGLRIPDEYIEYKTPKGKTNGYVNTFSSLKGTVPDNVDLVYEEIYIWMKGIENTIVNDLCLSVKSEMNPKQGYVYKKTNPVPKNKFLEFMMRPDFKTYGNEWDTKFEDYSKELQYLILKEKNPNFGSYPLPEITMVAPGEEVNLTLNSDMELKFSEEIVVNEKYGVTNLNSQQFYDRYYDKVHDNHTYSENMKSMLLQLCPVSSKYKFGLVSGFDEHLENDCLWEEAESQKADIHNGLKNRGLCKGNMEKHIGNLKKTKKDYTRDIVSHVDYIIGTGKELSYRLPSRKKGLEFLKGKVKATGTGVNVILDTSGSMWDGSIEKTMSTIFRNDLFVNLFQIDAQEVKSVTKIKSLRGFQKLKIEGGGGTELQPAVNHIKESTNPVVKKLDLIILTDGATDTLNLSGFNKVLIISTGSECPISYPPSKLKQLCIGNDVYNEG